MQYGRSSSGKNELIPGKYTKAWLSNWETVMQDPLVSVLLAYGHPMVAAAYSEASALGRDHLRCQLDSVDLEWIATAARCAGESVSSAERVMQYAEPPCPVRLGTGNELYDCIAAGEHELANGTVGLIIVAGGQGSRLGFQHAKGLFPIGPLSRRTLFEFLIDRVRAVSRRYAQSIPIYVMTSPATHAETIDYFQQNQFFGLPSSDVFIFRQGTLPAIDSVTGELLLADRQSLAMSPDGHGGMLSAFETHGGFQHARERGVQHLFYCQIDNPLTPACDSEIIGRHVLAAADVTTLAVRKTAPDEKVGNIVLVDGKARIVEYSDMPAEFTRLRADDGSLKFWAGNIGVHVFLLDFLQRVASSPDALPLHRARKQIESRRLDRSTWQRVTGEAIKFERFIFDILPLAERSLVLEANKHAVYAPVKNSDGEATNTPMMARRMIAQQHADLLRKAGVAVDPGVEVEVHPMWALDEADIAARFPSDTHIAVSTYFHNAIRHPTLQTTFRSAKIGESCSNFLNVAVGYD